MTRPVLVMVDGASALASSVDAVEWVRSRLATLAPSVIVTMTTAGVNEAAAEYGYKHGATVLLYETTGRITGSSALGRWTPDACPERGDAAWRDWFNRRSIVMASHVAHRRNRYDVTLLSARANADHHGKGFASLIARAFGIREEQMTPRGAA